MAKIKCKDTNPEIVLRKYLFSMGYRYRLNLATVTGKPDIVLPKYHAVIFVHGCFWHQHGCSIYKRPKTHTSFWDKKFETNKKRDLSVQSDLLSNGWRVGIIWECALSSKRLIKTEQMINCWIKSNRKRIEIPKQE